VGVVGSNISAFSTKCLLLKDSKARLAGEGVTTCATHLPSSWLCVFAPVSEWRCEAVSGSVDGIAGWDCCGVCYDSMGVYICQNFVFDGCVGVWLELLQE
jgi:hypothetical protein